MTWQQEIDIAVDLERKRADDAEKRFYEAREQAHAAEARADEACEQAHAAEARAQKYEKMLRELGKL
ncbi:hypothetical protein [Fibrobacter sp.]|uniref:hypothetical protein n=1 Tax=Fibrobacter sp. TaxID=35828 RepID=UPI0038906062